MAKFDAPQGAVGTMGPMMQKYMTPGGNPNGMQKPPMSPIQPAFSMMPSFMGITRGGMQPGGGGFNERGGFADPNRNVQLENNGQIMNPQGSNYNTSGAMGGMLPTEALRRIMMGSRF